MTVIVGVLKECLPGECRVALVPEVAAKYLAAGAQLLVERGAGVLAQFPDASFKDI